MKPRDTFEVALRRLAAQFIGECRDVFLRQKWRSARMRGARDEEDGENNVTHETLG